MKRQHLLPLLAVLTGCLLMGTRWPASASGKWLNGYSDHFPTEILLIAR